MRQDPVGQVLGGKYRVVRRLGGGGVAEVYEAVHETIGQRFAIKILKREYAGYPEVSHRFLTEARAASAIGHPGIVQVFDIGDMPTGEPYLVMELLQGEDLAEVLQRKKKLGSEESIGVCLHVLDALHAAHKAGVIHRDLKPENILLVRGPDGQPWAKIIDFGIARLEREGTGAQRGTAQGTVVGTPYYISPEQARGVQTIDGRADVYAVGVMLYELLTGKLPYDGVSVDDIIAKALSEPFPSARALESKVSEPLEQVIFKATRRNRDQRFASAAEFADALRSLRGETITVQMLTPEEEEADAEVSSLRRLKELAAAPPARSASVPPPRAAGMMTPARLNAATTPPGVRAAGTPTGLAPALTPARLRAAMTPAGGIHRSLPPPPPGRVGTGTSPPVPAKADTLTVPMPRRALLLLVAGVAAVVAAAAAVVVVAVLKRDPADVAASQQRVAAGSAVVPVRSPDAGGASPAPTAASAPLPADAAAESAAAPVSAPDAGGDALLVAAAADAGTPDPEADPSAKAADAADADLPRAAKAVVRISGLPPGARTMLDGELCEAELQLTIGSQHTLRVVAPGSRPFVRTFRVSGAMQIPVTLESGGETAPDSPRADAGARDAPRLLANPFGE